MQPAPQVGHPIPIFEVQDAKRELISPDRLLGHPYVLYFYPKDETPGCTKQACDLRDLKAELDQLGAKVIGVSPDSAASHHNFMAKHSLNFILVPDPFYELCSLFGVWEEKRTEGHVKWQVTRTTFVVDAKNIIRWIEKPVQVEGHAERVLQALKNVPKASDYL